MQTSLPSWNAETPTSASAASPSCLQGSGVLTSLDPPSSDQYQGQPKSHGSSDNIYAQAESEQSKDGTSRKDGGIDMIVFEKGRAERA